MRADIIRKPFLVSVRTLIKDLHVDYGTFKRVTLAPHACDMIDEEHLSSRKIVFSRKTQHDESIHAAKAPQLRRSAFRTLD